METSNSTNLDWLYYGPNVFNTFEQSISIYLGGSINDVSSPLTVIVSYKVMLSRGKELLLDQSEIDKISGNTTSGYRITIPISHLTESLSEGSELLDLTVSAFTDSDQSFHLIGKIQYLNCNILDFDEFDATDCRWSCQLQPSVLGDYCEFCF